MRLNAASLLSFLALSQAIEASPLRLIKRQDISSSSEASATGVENLHRGDHGNGDDQGADDDSDTAPALIDPDAVAPTGSDEATLTSTDAQATASGEPTEPADEPISSSAGAVIPSDIFGEPLPTDIVEEPLPTTAEDDVTTSDVTNSNESTQTADESSATDAPAQDVRVTSGEGATATETGSGVEETEASTGSDEPTISTELSEETGTATDVEASQAPTASASESTEAPEDVATVSETDSPTETSNTTDEPSTIVDPSETISTVEATATEDPASTITEDPTATAVESDSETQTQDISTEPADDESTGPVPTETATESSSAAAEPADLFTSEIIPTGTVNLEVPTIETAFPTATTVVSDEILAENEEKAKNLNEIYAGIKPDSSCTANQIACIEGNLGICGEAGAFQISACQAGTRCLALPMTNTEGVKVGCFEDPLAGDLPETSSAGEVTVSVTVQPTITVTAIVTAPAAPAPLFPTDGLQFSSFISTVLIPAPSSVVEEPVPEEPTEAPEPTEVPEPTEAPEPTPAPEAPLPSDILDVIDIPLSIPIDLGFLSPGNQEAEGVEGAATPTTVFITVTVREQETETVTATATVTRD
ncbi:unnamed protein product [Parascedosporium putredinis]|uniref:Carbohydrate-binding module family 19 domain-containing protein n=1 Tax=Parascedosporium putredinis TaxID=1442378 RepID=A0A9P1MC58_9PEZI|nr:unnamed protein product [Parascedosporium putredinis]CAI7999998.1 unnamed protein product [Parascedosporium putredinis]